VIFRVLVVLDPTLCELENRLSGTVRQREKIDTDILQDRQLPPQTGARALDAPNSAPHRPCNAGQDLSAWYWHLPD
jgi:hypothetical protein